EIYIEFEEVIIDQTNDIVTHYELNKGFNNMDSIFPKLHDLVVSWPFSNTNTTLLQLLNSNQINTIQNRQLKEELIAYNQEINLFTKNTNTNNTNLIDNLTSLKFMKNGAFAVYGVSDRMLEKFNDMYSTEIIKVADNKLKQISTQILNEPKTKLEVINMVVFRNALSNLQKSGNLGLKKRSEQVLQLLKEEISLLE
ncbi:MAG: hypothetical protein IMY67_10690, partial [Bacteroidetes bacterium]|nr:hypothetical protein [Bacteroidota bacterium]